jgi:hypothetical protein
VNSHWNETVKLQLENGWWMRRYPAGVSRCGDSSNDIEQSSCHLHYQLIHLRACAVQLALYYNEQSTNRLLSWRR